MKEPKLLIEARQLCLKPGEKYLLKNISFSISEAEALAIAGESGSGKTLLGQILAGQISFTSGELVFHLPPDCRKLLISQQHNFRDASARSYYQQRFDSNYGEESPSVEAELNSLAGNMSAGDRNNFEASREKISASLKIQHLYNTRLIELSNGEGKRVQLAKGLLMNPGLIVLDNPFLGLDTDTRKILHDMINELILEGMIVILITSVKEIPEAITSVMELEHGEIKRISPRNEFLASTTAAAQKFKSAFALLDDISPSADQDFKVAVEMRNVSVSFWDKKILDNISWKVLKGERWGLTGQNGSGKSTLLSLINADNPQGYGNELWLFDRKKGSGESIWEIKSRIGYISPELHIFFQRNLSATESLVMTNASQDLSAYAVSGTNAFEAVASGFNDQVGSSQKISSYQKKQVLTWMEILGIRELAAEPLYKISLGKQRLVLLARALVKNPPLLILDEPCQGLDHEQTRLFTAIVDEVCTRLDKTLIYVSHYPEDFPSCVDRFIRLEKGKAVS